MFVPGNRSKTTIEKKKTTGVVHYTFEYSAEIDFPECIQFGHISATIKKDKKQNYVIEGIVEGVELDLNKSLKVFIATSGRTGFTWRIYITYNGKKLSRYPLQGTIKNNGFYTESGIYDITDSNK